MSVWRNIMNRLTRDAITYERDERAWTEIQKERDAAVEELECMRHEYETLKRSVIEMIEAQRELQRVTSNLFEENKSLKQIGHINAIFRSGGLKQ